MRPINEREAQSLLLIFRWLMSYWKTNSLTEITGKMSVSRLQRISKQIGDNASLESEHAQPIIAGPGFGVHQWTFSGDSSERPRKGPDLKQICQVAGIHAS